MTGALSQPGHPTPDPRDPPAPRELTLICAWCPDARAKTIAALASGRTVTHGMCPPCAARMAAESETD